MVREELIEKMLTGVVDSVILAHWPVLRKKTKLAGSCDRTTKLGEGFCFLGAGTQSDT